MRDTTLWAVLGLSLMGTLCGGRLAGQEHQHQPPGTPTTTDTVTPLYDNLGTLHHEVTAESPVAQQYFDQGSG
jgi:hypothetical protein